MAKDPYKILGVERSAAADEIKRAYRRLAKESHPDRNPGDKSAEKRFKEIQAAYEVLGDADRRAQFDRFGEGGPRPHFEQWSRPGHAGGDGVQVEFGDFGNLGSIFEQFFTRGAAGGGRRRRGAETAPGPRGADLTHDVWVSFNEWRQGAQREIRLESAQGGSEELKFRIPPGIGDGQRIRLAGKGQPGMAGPGDLLVTVHVQPHPHFRREGRDVLLDLPVSLTEAALGARLEIPTPDGSATLTIPPGTSSGAKLRIRGQGAQSTRSHPAGDFLAVIRIIAPRNLSPRARELLTELDQELEQEPRADADWNSSRSRT